MSEDLDARLEKARGVVDAGFLVDLGCDLAANDRHIDAERCFRRALELGEEWVWFNVGNALASQARFVEAADAFRRGIASGDSDGWLNLGQVLEELGDETALDAYRSGSAAGDANCTVQLAFIAREHRDHGEAERLVASVAGRSDRAAAVLACWQYCRTGDPRLEQALRDGASHFGAARGDLATLLYSTGRQVEALQVLQLGAKLGEREAFIMLGNLYRDVLDDDLAAEDAYRLGIDSGDMWSHHNLAIILEERGEHDEAVAHYRLADDAGSDFAAAALIRLSEES
jgi:tetratricopeptide (TPR) repeat protein